MRRVIAAISVVGALLVAAPASAQVFGLQIDRQAVLRDDGGIDVHGTISCTPGQSYAIRITVRQAAARGVHRSRWTCENGPDSFTLAVYPSQGTFEAGPARVNVVVGTTDGHTVQRERVVEVLAP